MSLSSAIVILNKCGKGGGDAEVWQERSTRGVWSESDAEGVAGEGESNVEGVTGGDEEGGACTIWRRGSLNKIWNGYTCTTFVLRSFACPSPFEFRAGLCRKQPKGCIFRVNVRVPLGMNHTSTECTTPMTMTAPSARAPLDRRRATGL